jgi:hypothetical protein
MRDGDIPASSAAVRWPGPKVARQISLLRDSASDRSGYAKSSSSLCSFETLEISGTEFNSETEFRIIDFEPALGKDDGELKQERRGPMASGDATRGCRPALEEATGEADGPPLLEAAACLSVPKNDVPALLTSMVAGRSEFANMTAVGLRPNDSGDRAGASRSARRDPPGRAEGARIPLRRVSATARTLNLTGPRSADRTEQGRSPVSATARP